MNVIIKPLVTEKSMKGVDQGRVSFQVSRFASKTDIKKAIQDTFKVSVTAVSTNVVKGKTKRVGKRRQEKTLTEWKKAVVVLKKGDKISLFESGAEEKKEDKK